MRECIIRLGKGKDGCFNASQATRKVPSAAIFTIFHCVLSLTLLSALFQLHPAAYESSGLLHVEGSGLTHVGRLYKISSLFIVSSKDNCVLGLRASSTPSHCWRRIKLWMIQIYNKDFQFWFFCAVLVFPSSLLFSCWVSFTWIALLSCNLVFCLFVFSNGNFVQKKKKN